MFMNYVHKKEEIRSVATEQLRLAGIKYRPKKTKQEQVRKFGKKFFKVPLQSLETETVTLKDGRQLIIPKRVHEMCSFILTKVEVEGIFRKEGSKARQNEIKFSIDQGKQLGRDHHVVDVAVVLKSFLRELPEPLIPQSYHEMFLRSSLKTNSLELIILVCLLLPMEQLNLLSYLMLFFCDVASYSECNKMNSYNLAVVIGPNIFPVEEKQTPKFPHMLTKISQIVKLMIDNAKFIGMIPEYIIEQMGSVQSCNDPLDKRKKKRRSASLTRVLNGLKKIVTSKTGDEHQLSNVVTPDLLLTPSINRSVKKKKPDIPGLSSKKKKDVLNKLPEATLLNTPFTPSRTPVSINPNPKNNLQSEELFDEVTKSGKEKKTQWYSRSRSVKYLKQENEGRRNSMGARAILERRWSAVSQVANFKKRKNNARESVQSTGVTENSSSESKNSDTSNHTITDLSTHLEHDYVRVSKAEYEEIKSRVSAIEQRISLEFENVQVHTDNNENNSNTEIDNNIKSVQNAYEQTLVQSQQLSPTTDHLARRLSKELRIRRSSEQKIIRSPSARKIGSMRRRSQEVERHSAKLRRNQSWHVPNTHIIPRVNCKKQKSATLIVKLSENLDYLNKSQNQRVTRSSSIKEKSHASNNTSSFSSSLISCNTSGSSTNQWVSAEGFFSSSHNSDLSLENGRSSLIQLRNQNAGMVLAKAKLFDNVKEHTRLTSDQSSQRMDVQNKEESKIGSQRCLNARLSYRVRTLRTEDRRLKKSISPRRRNANYSQRQKLHIAKQYADANNKACTQKENYSGPISTNGQSPVVTPTKKYKVDVSNSVTPTVPQIKKSLTVRSPKRLCRTPNSSIKSTPLKVLNTPRCGL